ncbi:MAG: zf-HC2 domain-containing protein [Candidatus Aureabacteria bacterium]|nr:zf-HC2 domain-containing protein [Candidatus Auribacterota bacterium]
MNCEQVKEMLSAYLDEAVSGEEKNLLEQHLLGCSVCSREYDSLKEYRKLMTGLEQVKAPDHFLDEFHRRLGQEISPAKEESVLSFRYLYRTIGVAAVFFIAIWGYYHFIPEKGKMLALAPRTPAPVSADSHDQDNKTESGITEELTTLTISSKKKEETAFLDVKKRNEEGARQRQSFLFEQKEARKGAADRSIAEPLPPSPLGQISGQERMMKKPMSETENSKKLTEAPKNSLLGISDRKDASQLSVRPAPAAGEGVYSRRIQPEAEKELVQQISSGSAVSSPVLLDEVISQKEAPVIFTLMIQPSEEEHLRGDSLDSSLMMKQDKEEVQSGTKQSASELQRFIPKMKDSHKEAAIGLRQEVLGLVKDVKGEILEEEKDKTEIADTVPSVLALIPGESYQPFLDGLSKISDLSGTVPERATSSKPAQKIKVRVRFKYPVNE